MPLKAIISLEDKYLKGVFILFRNFPKRKRTQKWDYYVMNQRHFIKHGKLTIEFKQEPTIQEITSYLEKQNDKSNALQLS